MRKSKITDHLFYLIMGTVYTYALSKSIIMGTVLSIPTVTIFILSLSFIFILYIYFFNKYTVIAFSAIIAFLAAFTFMSLVAGSFQTEWYLELSGFINEIYWFIRGYFPYNERYDLTLAAFTVFSFALVSVINIRVRFNFYILSVIGFCIILIPVIMNYYRTNEVQMLFSFCFLVFFAKKLNLIAKSSKMKLNADFALAMIPLCAIICLFTGILPKPGVNNGTNGPIIRREIISQNAINSVNDFFYEAFNPKYFDFQTSGFTGKDGRLGGRVIANNRFVMEVYANKRVYLSGSVKDLYTGWSWRNTKTDKSALKEYEDTAFILPYDPPYKTYAKKTDSESIMISFDSIGYEERVRINIGSDRTQTIFTPLNTSKINFNSNVTLYKNVAGELSVDKLLSKNAEYTVTYNDINNNDLLDAVLLTDLNVDKNYLSAYLALPDTLPKRVKELARKTAPNNMSDYEKMKALEEYMRGYKYTLEPENVPTGEDFVDYFLFSGKEGYCTYYASALAVMGRCVGVPTRYVEGYTMPNSKNSNGAYEVTSYQAHAWVEGFINGLGWVAFEPTAPFAYTFYRESTEVPATVFSDSMYQGDNSYYEYMMGMGFPANRSLASAEAVNPEMPAEEIYATLEFYKTIMRGVLVFLLALSAFIAVKVLFRRLKFKKVDKYSNKAAAVVYFKYILMVAKVYTYPIMKNETAFDYAKRVGRRFAFENETIFMKDLAKIFSKASYGINEISDEEKARMKNCYLEFLDMLKMYRLFKIQFFFYKYVISII